MGVWKASVHPVDAIRQLEAAALAGDGKAGEIRKPCGFERPGDPHVILRCSIGPPELDLQPRQPLAMLQLGLRRNQFPADLDDAGARGQSSVVADQVLFAPGDGDADAG